MRIYFFSVLNGNKFAGPSYSVPRTIFEVAKRESVVWINLLPDYKLPFKTNGNLVFINNFDYHNEGLDEIMRKYGRPDCVIFEEVLNINYCFIGRKLCKMNIPYIIVPRGCLCKDAQAIKALKKKIANILFFNHFIKNARSIQYLTDKELVDSGKKWNNRYFISPNGIDIPINRIVRNYQTPIKGLFIGRIDLFHKGLDLLIEACSNMRQVLDGKVIFDIYGADSVGHKGRLLSLIKSNKLENIINVYDAVYDQDKIKVLNEHDFFVLTSRFEGLPMGLLEALSYGLPALVTDGCNIGKEIKQANCGWNSDISVSGICNSLEILLTKLDELQAYSFNAIELSKRYNWEKVIDNLVYNIYDIIGEYKSFEE